ncbi:mRNA export factor mex67 [Smittium mucronatum]|uniref:mRNA export factor MEX67 n=1 Tax=Smittium mucronatum TaxID=133383 RepID=A0A1R0H999_9FUNG|nr:mRNA export factor mex67 [Smittium mucronatum]
MRELILIDTLARNNELSLADGETSYIKQVTSRFPSLEILDLVVLSPEIRAYALEESKRLAKEKPGKTKDSFDSYSRTKNLSSWTELSPINPSFSDSPESTNLAQGFIAGYYQLYDRDRPDLANVYSSDAVFSINTNVSTISGSSQSSTISHYVKFSRNLTRVKNRGKRYQTLAVGNRAICEKIKELPASSHNLADPSKLVFDVWSMTCKLGSPTEPPSTTPGSSVDTNCIMLVVHGMFTEIDSPNHVFSFDRTFILSEAPPSSVALANGWPCIIRRDLLTIRNHNPSTSFTLTLPPPSLQPPAAVSEDVASVHNNMVQQLCLATGLNAEWSAKCLSDTNWDYNKALQAFSIFKEQLPAQAFS